jgi:chemotaxis protein histidine kinase CheA
MKMNSRLMHLFKAESQIEIREIAKGLACLKNESRTMADDSRIIGELHRNVHTLKSSSATAGFHNLNEITSALTEIFRAAGDGRCEIRTDIIPLLEEGVDACRNLLEKSDKKEGTPDYENLLNRLGKLLP